MLKHSKRSTANMSANSTDTIKPYRVKSINHVDIVDLAINLVMCPVKEAKCTICQKNQLLC